ncbi:MAG: transposase [Chloroflexi bacterium]|nr:transposase [Chloroflexota bacterium]
MDKGYSGRPLYRLVHQQYRSTPIVDLPRQYKKLMAEFGEQMSTPEWKAIYKQRGAIERVNSRLKLARALNCIRVRGKHKVTVHCYLSLVALQALFRSSNLESGGIPPLM